MTTPKNSFWQDLKQELRDIWHGLDEQWRYLALGLHNARRGRHKPGYVVTRIGGSLPERGDIVVSA